MSAFIDEADLRRNIARVGLDDLAERIVATARPAIEFIRQQRHDDSLPVGTSKIGGLPDLPPGFVWPTRPPLADTDDGAKPAPAQEGALAESLCETFPLAFLAQFNCAELARQPGFDSDLPRHGHLVIFEDITTWGDDVRTFWLDVSASDLQRRALPEKVISLSDAQEPDNLWHTLDMADVLIPYSVLTIPHHFFAVCPDWDAFYDLFGSRYCPVSRSLMDGNVADWIFGDRLGGWPEPIQNDPELEYLDDTAPAQFAPGDDRVRQIFSWGGEYNNGVRRVWTRGGGDGTTHILIHRAALLARDFSQARAIYQCD